MSFQKFPVLSEEQNWPTTTSNDGANFIPFTGKEQEKPSKKEEEFLAQLFDMSTMFKDDLSSYDIPSNNDVFIPMQTPSPSMNTEPLNQSPSQYQNDVSPQFYSPPPSDTQYYGNSLSYAPSPDNGSHSAAADPLVSTFNEGMSPPNNDIYPGTDTFEKPSDDLQILLNEILAVENLPMESNMLGPDNTSPNNDIPMTALIMDEEENNEIRGSEANQDTIIPVDDNFQFPPPSKKRHSESSMEESPPPSIKVKIPPMSLHPMSNEPLHSPLSDHEKSSPKTPSQKSRSSTSLFGQKEDEIIHKLLIPQRGSENKPITRDKLVTMNVEDFNALLDQVGLTEIEVAFMKEWRRRGKNKMAAQIARKRKRDELSDLQDEIKLLRHQKAQLKQSASSLKASLSSFKRRAELAEERIYRKYSATHGLLVSKETHNIHVTDDGKTMLVPRISSQVLLV